MRWQDEERRRRKEAAHAVVGFSRGMSLNDGLIVGADTLTASGYESAIGVVIPWMGSPHVKIVLTED
jgi:hypothetical protein